MARLLLTGLLTDREPYIYRMLPRAAPSTRQERFGKKNLDNVLDELFRNERELWTFERKGGSKGLALRAEYADMTRAIAQWKDLVRKLRAQSDFFYSLFVKRGTYGN